MKRVTKRQLRRLRASTAALVRPRKARPLGISLARFTSALAVAGALVAGTSLATTYYWDSDGTAAGNTVGDAGAGGLNLGGAGTWDTTTPTATFWRPFALTDVAWDSLANANDAVVIQGGAAGAIVLGQPTSAGTIIFNTNGYSIGTSTLTLSGAGSVAGTITLGSTVATAAINSVLDGTNGLLFNGNGAGILTLSAANTIA
ncbi:MAG TPA: hypothetical protein VGO11_11155, partial [Chthoniobacteraceae bacterium]|nr:hypothetical protein [Chthoniobacteraceae bacterium]